MRDAALFAGKTLGGFHGPEDMSFQDIYSAHIDAGSRFTSKTNSWMASSPFSEGDSYRLARGAAYTGMDLASGFLFPFGKLKTAATAGKTILKAERIAHSSPTLLKTRQITAKIFKSTKQKSLPPQTIRPIWTSHKKYSTLENAYKHWGDHRKDFPNFVNAKQYVEETHRFTRNPPSGTLRKVRFNGDIIFYHPISNVFAITTKSGIPRTMFKPNKLSHKLSSNLEYFNAQK